jgi:hypothetical protein
LLTTTASYLSVSANLTKSQATEANNPTVKNDTAYYLANIGKVKSIADFVGNYRLFSYAMKAYGLEDMNYAKGLITKVLQGGVTDTKALANTLTDPRYKAFATAFDFVGQGSSVTASTAATTGTTAKYVEQSLEDDQGTQNQGVQLALYFTRMAPSVTNIYGLLADKNLLKVVQTAFGLPTSASTDIDAQASTLSKLIKLSDLQDPTKVQKIAERFTAMWDLGGNNTSSDVSNVSQIFASSSSTGFSTDLLLSLQGLKLGGG